MQFEQSQRGVLTVTSCFKLKPGLFYMYISMFTSSFCNVLLHADLRSLILKKNGPILQDIALERVNGVNGIFIFLSENWEGATSEQ
eukprot:COSAG02_NODE_17508_length_998_cov_5.788654_2_plen_86_part_00